MDSQSLGRSPTGEAKQCQSCAQEFWIEPEDFQFYEKIKVTPPTWCPDCRLQRRISVRNERSLYKDVCDLCGKSFVSMYSSDKPFKVYCKECWYSDGWNVLSYGREYDFSKPFFTQFRQLMEAVPHMGIVYVHQNTNCDYANYVADSKNVYLSQSVIEKCEDVYYSKNIDNSREVFDCLGLKDGQQCYCNVDGNKNYRCKFLIKSRECINSAFLFDCVNCQDCFMSSNLRNKQFVIRNKQYSKEEYAAEIASINARSKTDLKNMYGEFLKLTEGSIHKFANLVKTANCIGDNLENSKNVLWSFDIYGSENLKFCHRCPRMQDSYDTYGGADGELLYEATALGHRSYNSQWAFFGDSTVDSQYTNACLNSSNCFGCVGLRNKQYCIFNKQYTKEEYEALVPKIIEHMNSMPYTDKKGGIYKYGEFLPTELSPFAYNETIAHEYFPLTKEQAIEQGYQWKDSEERNYQITNEIIECAHKGGCSDQCTTAFRVIPQESQFYQTMNLPLPTLCPNCRYAERFVQRNPLKLWHRKCANCSNEFETSYAPDRPEIVYCEQCYQAEVA